MKNYIKIAGLMLFCTAQLQGTYAVVKNFTNEVIKVGASPSFVRDVAPGAKSEMAAGLDTTVAIMNTSGVALQIVEYGKEGIRVKHTLQGTKQFYIPAGWVLGFSVCPQERTDCPVPW